MFTLLKWNRWHYSVFLMLFSCHVQSGVRNAYESLQVHGFVNQGYFLSSANNVYGDSSSARGSFDFTEVGVNASVRASTSLNLSAQAIYRKAGALSNNAKIDFAVFDWTILNTGSRQIGVRLGRIKNPIGFFNETRDMVFTRPSIKLPEGIYYERLRNLLLSADAGQLYFNQSSGFGEFGFQFSIGDPLSSEGELEQAYFGFDAPGSLDPKTSYLARLAYESHSGATRFAITQIKLDLNYRASTNDIFDEGEIAIDYLLFSAQQRINKLSLTLEYLIQDNELSDFGLVLPNLSTTSISYYAQADYQLNEKFQFNLRFDATYSNEADKDGEQYSVQTGRPQYAAYSKGKMFGLSWFPDDSWMLRAEYHQIKGTSLLTYVDNSGVGTKEWDLVALQLSYRF